MFNKNLKYYRLKSNLSKKELAARVNVTPMTITHYEKGDRKPDMDTIKSLANTLNVRVTDFLSSQNDNLVFQHNAFRKNCKLSKNNQELVRATVEEYFGRFFTAVDLLGGNVLPEAPKCQTLSLSINIEECANSLRRYLGLPEFGPVGNLIEVLENQGILIYFYDADSQQFFGMNGTVNGRPYIIINKNMTAERIRTTIIHEIAHFAFSWPNSIDEKECEKKATAISGAFLFPKQDATRELGIHRNAITKDMQMICKEYGISMSLMAYRAKECGIINEYAYKSFCIKSNQIGLRKCDSYRKEKEEPTLFKQLVYRAVSENEISVQKGSELLKMPFDDVAKECYFREA